jgi:hypothetical protein
MGWGPSAHTKKNASPTNTHVREQLEKMREGIYIPLLRSGHPGTNGLCGTIHRWTWRWSSGATLLRAQDSLDVMSQVAIHEAFT